jgi:hypothetical protein
MSWPAVGVPFQNDGHAGAGALAAVHVNPESRATYEQLVKDSELPTGTTLAITHGAAPDGRGGPVYVMQKSGATWEFLRLGPDGALPDGPTTAAKSAMGCRACHADGVADALFGVPLSARALRGR